MGSGTYFLRDGDTLRVVGDLTWDVTNAFDQACRTLVAEVEGSPVVDLTEIDALGSTHLGILAATALEAVADGKELVIRAGPALERVLQVSELGRMATLEYAGGP